MAFAIYAGVVNYLAGKGPGTGEYGQAKRKAP
jgi:N-acetylmuramoyl-L-alanine amidase